jgi:isopentenyl-diphosphate delta-isomerase
MAGRHVGSVEPDHEHVVLLDESGTVIGTALKAEVHTTDTPLHLAFSCYVVGSDGRVLLTQRAPAKRTWPGVWTNACCGHPGLGEDLVGAVLRRLGHELGIRGEVEVTPLLPDFRYRAVMDNGIVENEICPVFLARVPAGVTVTPDPSEVADHRWVTPAELRALIAAGDVPVSPWAVLQMERLAGDDWAAAAGSPTPTSAPTPTS